MMHFGWLGRRQWEHWRFQNGLRSARCYQPLWCRILPSLMDWDDDDTVVSLNGVEIMTGSNCLSTGSGWYYGFNVAAATEWLGGNEICRK